MSSYLVVSLHDVTPAHEPNLRAIVETFKRYGPLPLALLVVPNYHGRWELARFPKFVNWLHDLQAAGHEIVLHGLEHQERSCDYRPERWLARLLYSREGEFYTLDYATARQKMEAGLARFVSLGFKPTGFVAPAWMYNAQVVRAGRDLGFRYQTTLWALLDLQRNRSLKAPVLCFSPRSPKSALGSSLYSRVLYLLIKNQPLLRLAIHPGDINRPVIWRTVGRLMADWSGRRDPITYRTFCQRVLDGPGD